MSEGPTATWIAPDGAIGGEAPDGALGAGWIRYEPGPVPRILLREGAVDTSAARALRAYLAGLADDMPVDCLRGSERSAGPLGAVVARIAAGSWFSRGKPDPRDQLASAMKALGAEMREAAIGDWLRTGDASARDPERETEALAAIGAAAERAGAIVVRGPEPLRHGTPGAALAAARSWVARATEAQDALEAAWNRLAGESFGAVGEPVPPAPLPDTDGDVLVTVRRVMEARRDLSGRGVYAVLSTHPDGPRAGRALGDLRRHVGLPRRHLVAAAEIVSGDAPERLADRLGFLLSHECMRTYGFTKWRIRDLFAERDAHPAPGGPGR